MCLPGATGNEQGLVQVSCGESSRTTLAPGGDVLSTTVVVGEAGRLMAGWVRGGAGSGWVAGTAVSAAGVAPGVWGPGLPDAGPAGLGRPGEEASAGCSP